VADLLGFGYPESRERCVGSGNSCNSGWSGC